MYTGDDIFKVVYAYNFDLFRGPLSISEYLEKHYKKYVSDIQNALKGSNPLLEEADFISILNDKMTFLEDICAQIVDISKTYGNGLIHEAYKKAYQLFDDMSPFLHTRISRPGKEGFYRLRQGNFSTENMKETNERKEKKAELFHIKQKLNHLIGAYRYSVPGYPCLYLSTERELAWYECGMPRQFSYCQMQIEEQGENELKLVDFSLRPTGVLPYVHISIESFDESEMRKANNTFLNYILAYPLAAACSIQVKNRDNRFVEEYVLPQIFMQWVRESDRFEGIKYKSSLFSYFVEGLGATNIVLATKEFRDDGLCKNLTSKI